MSNNYTFEANKIAKLNINKHKITMTAKYATHNSSQQVEKIFERLVISPWSEGYQVWIRPPSMKGWPELHQIQKVDRALSSAQKSEQNSRNSWAQWND